MTKEEYVKKVDEIYVELQKQPPYGMGYFQVRFELIDAILHEEKTFPETCEELKNKYRYSCGF